MRLFLAAVSVAVIMALGASAALAGEVTGNGTLKQVNGNSPCAFSGQEDLQYFTDDGDGTPKTPTKGEPAHSQTYGQIVSAAGGNIGGANETDAFGFPWGCNAHEFGLKNGNSGP